MPLFSRVNVRMSKKSKIRASLFIGCGLRELVKYMEVTLIQDLAHDSSFLQEIVRNLSSNRLSSIVKHDLEVFALRDHAISSISLCKQ